MFEARVLRFVYSGSLRNNCLWPERVREQVERTEVRRRFGGPCFGDDNCAPGQKRVCNAGP